MIVVGYKHTAQVRGWRTGRMYRKDEMTVFAACSLVGVLGYCLVSMPWWGGLISVVGGLLVGPFLLDLFGYLWQIIGPVVIVVCWFPFIVGLL
jgi:hypothetical protein